MNTGRPSNNMKDYVDGIAKVFNTQPKYNGPNCSVFGFSVQNVAINSGYEFVGTIEFDSGVNYLLAMQALNKFTPPLFPSGNGRMLGEWEDLTLRDVKYKNSQWTFDKLSTGYASVFYAVTNRGSEPAVVCMSIVLANGN